jgi:hypothetical protein
MCSLLREAGVTVCDVAIGRVPFDLDDVFPGAIRFLRREDEATLAEAGSAVASAPFDTVARAAIVAAQERGVDGASRPR